MSPVAVDVSLSTKALNASVSANAAARGTYVTAGELAADISDARLLLKSDLKRGGNMAAAKIDVDGVPTTMLAHSALPSPSENLVAQGFVGQTDEFNTFAVPNAAGAMIPRANDSEATILGNIAAKLGNNSSASGSITILSERPACASCTSVIEQFRSRYPGITVNVYDNNGVLLRSSGAKVK